jgi:hypothetical protein
MKGEMIVAKDTINTEIIMAVDNGSSHIKAVWDDLSQTFQFPNIVSQPFAETTPLQDIGDPLDFLDVTITSPAIQEVQYRHVYVGNRAIADSGVVHEVVGAKAAQKKAERPETIVTLLTATAYAVAKKEEARIRKGSKIQAKVYLGTGLPISEYLTFKDAFADKLTGLHTVQFEKTPVFGGVTVELNIELPEGVQIDGVSAVYDMEATGKTKMSQRSFGVADIGGVDLDICFFKNDLQLDVLKPYAAKIGLNDVLDQIRKEINSKHTDLIRTTADLVRRLVEKNYEVRRRGKIVVDLRDFVEKPLRTLAERAYDSMLSAWDTADYATEFWFVGGGSLILAPYIKDINDLREKATIYFDDGAYSQFRNARGAFVVVKESVTQQRESAATLEE